MQISTTSDQIFRRHIALPQDHGSWVFLLSPLLIGFFAASSPGLHWSVNSLALIIAALAAFLIRQPATILVKVVSGRRPQRELTAALFWFSTYATLGVFALFALIEAGFGYLLYLALPGLPVFGWHLWLVSRRSERRQIGIEMVATGVLALSAPAALWVRLGVPDPSGWRLFGLTWFQSAASIVYAYLRLEQRSLPTGLSRLQAFQIAHRALLYTGFNFLATLCLALIGLLPLLIPIPFLVQFGETIWGAFHPAIGIKPARIGLRQLAVSMLFTLLFVLAWRFSPG